MLDQSVERRLGEISATLTRLPEGTRPQIGTADGNRVRASMETFGDILLHYPDSERSIEVAKQIFDVISFEPTDPLFHFIQGHLLRNAGDIENAAHSFSCAAELYGDLVSNPSQPQHLFIQERRYEALAAVFELRPTIRVAQELILEAHELSRFDLALHWAERTVVVTDEHPTARLILADALFVSGRYEDAERAFRAMLGNGEATGFPEYRLTQIPGYSVDENFLSYLLNRRATMRRSSYGPHLDFAIARSYETLGDFERAFQFYRSGNSSMRARFTPDDLNLDEEIETVRMYQEGYAGVTVKPRTQEANRFPFQPLFIVGLPRSGTSLLAKMLGSLPSDDREAPVYNAGELTQIGRIDKILQAHLPNGAGIPDVIVDSLSNAYVDSIARQFNLGGERQPRFVVDKLPQNYWHLNLINTFFPNAPILHCVRDPVDNAISLYRQCFGQVTNLAFSYDLSDIGKYITQVYRPLMQLWDRVMPPGRILTVRYEDLVRAPEQTMRAVLDHCGLPWSDTVLTFHEQQTATDTEPGINRPLYDSSIGCASRYESHLGPLKRWLQLEA